MIISVKLGVIWFGILEVALFNVMLQVPKGTWNSGFRSQVVINPVYQTPHISVPKSKQA